MNTKTVSGYLLLLSNMVLSVSAEDLYVAQTQQGTGDGLSAANAKAVTFFNTSANWGAGAGKISPGDTVHLVGTVTTALVFQASGTAGNPITLLFEANAKMTSAAWPNSGAINVPSLSYITIDGGSNGIIENTANGTNLGNKVDSTGVKASEGKNLIVKNLAINNMYVRVRGSDGFGYGTGVENTDDNGNGINNFKVLNCTIPNCYVGISADYGAGDNTYEFASNTVSFCNWGGRIGDRNSSSTITNVLVHHNTIYGFTNWDETVGNSFHHNGWYCWAENSGHFNGADFYANKIGPGFGGSFQTSGLFFSGNTGRVYLYNNLFVCSTNETVANGLITLASNNGGSGSNQIYNNTFFGGSGGQAIRFGGGNVAFDVKNNTVRYCDTAIAVVSPQTGTLTIDYNSAYGLNSGQAYIYLDNFQTAGQWAALGFDAHGVTGDPKLDSVTYIPQSSSPLIDAGQSQASLFTVDYAGVTRPQGSAWDIGAFELASGVRSGSISGNIIRSGNVISK